MFSLIRLNTYLLAVAHTWTKYAVSKLVERRNPVERFDWAHNNAEQFWIDENSFKMFEYTHVYGQGCNFTGKGEYTLTLEFFDADIIPTGGFKVKVLEFGTLWTHSSVKDLFNCIHDAREDCIKLWPQNRHNATVSRTGM